MRGIDVEGSSSSFFSAVFVNCVNRRSQIETLKLCDLYKSREASDGGEPLDVEALNRVGDLMIPCFDTSAFRISLTLFFFCNYQYY